MPWLLPVRRTRTYNRTHAERRDIRARLRVESLEGRQLLSTFTVTNVNDSGSGSLRQAIIASNATSGSTVNTINFDIGNGGGAIIALKSGLPSVSHPVVIDGTTQPGLGTTPGVVLNGRHAGSTAGLTLTASNSTVKGLVIDDFTDSGVVVDGAKSDTITDDYIGVTAAGNVAAGNGGDGVHLIDGAKDNVVSNDVISANADHGVDIDGGSQKNTVAGSMIGTDYTGTYALGNGDSGVYIENKSNDNVVGGTSSGTANVLSGNALRGVHIDSGSSDNTVEGNMIGTDVTGTKALGNADSGVLITGGADNNTVGGTTAAAMNVISANSQDGVHLYDASAGNVVEGNRIGTDVSGSKALGNKDAGVLIDDGSDNNVVGGTASGAGNTIAANQEQGVLINTGSDQNTIAGNLIGTTATGKKGLGNASDGIDIDNDSNGNVVGGTTSAAMNVVSANGYYGVAIENGSATNSVLGNFVGTNVTGSKPLGNSHSGVYVGGGSSDNVIGGTTTGAGNTISANGQHGVHIDGGSDGNVVEGNDIGTTAGGASPLGNKVNGVLIAGGSSGNVVGGTSSAAANTIADNGANGVELDSAGKGNLIEGDTLKSNASNGVYIDSSSYTTVSNCVITNNDGWGILVSGSSDCTLSNNTVAHNGLGNVKS